MTLTPRSQLGLMILPLLAAAAAGRRDGTPAHAVSCEERRTVYRRGPRVERNKPCPCGSGKKAKRCCHR
jgi:uncharacterized protein YecA (UPF0149 family)